MVALWQSNGQRPQKLRICGKFSAWLFLFFMYENILITYMSQLSVYLAFFSGLEFCNPGVLKLQKTIIVENSKLSAKKNRIILNIKG